MENAFEIIGNSMDFLYYGKTNEYRTHQEMNDFYTSLEIFTYRSGK